MTTAGTSIRGNVGEEQQAKEKNAKPQNGDRQRNARDTAICSGDGDRERNQITPGNGSPFHFICISMVTIDPNQ